MDMTDRRRMLTGISLGALVTMFSLAVMLNTAAAIPTTAATVHAAQAGLSQVEKAMAPAWVRPGLRPACITARACALPRTAARSAFGGLDVASAFGVEEQAAGATDCHLQLSVRASTPTRSKEPVQSSAARDPPKA